MRRVWGGSIQKDQEEEEEEEVEEEEAEVAAALLTLGRGLGERPRTFINCDVNYQTL